MKIDCIMTQIFSHFREGLLKIAKFWIYAKTHCSYEPAPCICPSFRTQLWWHCSKNITLTITMDKLNPTFTISLSGLQILTRADTTGFPSPLHCISSDSPEVPWTSQVPYHLAAWSFVQVIWHYLALKEEEWQASNFYLHSTRKSNVVAGVFVLDKVAT